MSGVIDDNGQQWEHCHVCNDFVRFPQNLGYQKPNADFRYGRHLCVKCADTLIRSGRVQFEDITPAPSWMAVEVAA